MVAKTLSPWSLAVMPQFASSTSLRFQELARAASGLFSVRVGIPPLKSGVLSQHQALSPIPCMSGYRPQGLKVRVGPKHTGHCTLLELNPKRGHPRGPREVLTAGSGRAPAGCSGTSGIDGRQPVPRVP